jgi:DNA-binding response OmpR family regulator
LVDIATHSPDLVILDIDLRLRDEDGLTLCKKIKSLFQDLYVVIHSSYISPCSSELDIADAVIPKPMSLAAMLPILGNLQNKPMVCLVDDDPAFLWLAKLLLNQDGIACKIYTDLSAFIRNVSDQEILNYSAVVFDMLFVNEGVDTVENQIPRDLKKSLNLNFKAFLCTHAMVGESDLCAAGFDGVIEKDANVLAKYLKAELKI